MSKNYKIYLKENNLLYFKNGKGEMEVSVKQCFPWSDPTKFLSLRNDDENEVFLIEDVNALDTETKSVIQTYLERISFVMEITSILRVEDEIELRVWEVMTKQGQRVFHTKLDAWPKLREDGSVLIEDIAGDLFVVTTMDSLDSKSQKTIQSFID